MATVIDVVGGHMESPGAVVTLRLVASAVPGCLPGVPRRCIRHIVRCLLFCDQSEPLR